MVAGMRLYLSATGMDVGYELAKASLVLSSELVTSPDGGFDIELMLHKLEEALDQAIRRLPIVNWTRGSLNFASCRN